MTAPTESTAVATTPKGAMVKLLEPRAEMLARLLPKGLDPQRVIAAAQLAAYKEPKLLECDPVSIFLAVGKVAQWGLEIGTTAYLVAYGKQCTPLKDYKGEIELVVRAKAARTVRVGIIRDGDRYEYEEGDTPRLKHWPLIGNRGKVVCYYAVAHHGGDVPPSLRIVSPEEAEEVRQKYSKQWKNGPMPDWYGIKTAVHRLCKYLAQGNASLEAAINEDLDPTEEVAGDFSLTPQERAYVPPKLRAPDSEDGYPTPGSFDPQTGEDLTDA